MTTWRVIEITFPRALNEAEEDILFSHLKSVVLGIKDRVSKPIAMLNWRVYKLAGGTPVALIRQRLENFVDNLNKIFQYEKISATKYALFIDSTNMTIPFTNLPPEIAKLIGKKATALEQVESTFIQAVYNACKDIRVEEGSVSFFYRDYVGR